MKRHRPNPPKKPCNLRSTRPRIKEKESAVTTAITTETTATESTDNKSYGMILELVLPFLNIDQDGLTFSHVSQVNQDLHQQCCQLLTEHCQQHHSFLWAMMERPPASQLTLQRYQHYRASDHGDATDSIDVTTTRRTRIRSDLPRRGLEDYEAALELTVGPTPIISIDDSDDDDDDTVSTTSHDYDQQPSQFVVDFQPLQLQPTTEEEEGEGPPTPTRHHGTLGCQFAPPLLLIPPSTPEHPQTLGLRIVLRHKTTGQLAPLLHTWDHYQGASPQLTIERTWRYEAPTQQAVEEFGYKVHVQAHSRREEEHSNNNNINEGEENDILHNNNNNNNNYISVDFTFSSPLQVGSDERHQGVVDGLLRAMDIMKWF